MIGRRKGCEKTLCTPGLCESFHGACVMMNPLPVLQLCFSKWSLNLHIFLKLRRGSASTKHSLQCFSVPLSGRVVVQNWDPQETWEIRQTQLYCLPQHRDSRSRKRAQLPSQRCQLMQVELYPCLVSLIMQPVL